VNDCPHLFVWRWAWPKSERYQCVWCDYLTRHYDSVDHVALRPIHPHMSVAYQGFNTITRRSAKELLHVDK
jgi:hypothetical protein